MPVIVQDLIRDALMEIGVGSQAESLGPGDATFALGRLNQLLDAWNADRSNSYAQRFVRNTLTPSLSPTTIGPTAATWTETVRPVTIESASLVLNTSSPDVLTPINLRDAQWWADQSVPDLTSDIPTDLYYEPTWPNGSLFFWPVPTTAYDVELEIRTVLAQVTLVTSLTLPPGYEEALVLSLAEKCARPFGKELDQGLVRDADLARARIMANNVTTPRLHTRDAGMPHARPAGNFPTFNYLIGS